MLIGTVRVPVRVAERGYKITSMMDSRESDLRSECDQWNVNMLPEWRKWIQQKQFGFVCVLLSRALNALEVKMMHKSCIQPAIWFL